MLSLSPIATLLIIVVTNVIMSIVTTIEVTVQMRIFSYLFYHGALNDLIMIKS